MRAFYNTRRRHFSLGGISPRPYEQRCYEQATRANHQVPTEARQLQTPFDLCAGEA